MEPQTERLMLLDAASMYFRAFHGIPDSVRAPDGTPVNAVRGFLDAIARLVSDWRPTRLVACMDADWRPAFRVAAIPSYKTHRVANPATNAEDVPDLLVPQVAIIEEVLDAFGLARLGIAGHEADDVIGTLATRADVPVLVVTGDRDLFQLVDDARDVRVLYTGRGMANLALVDDAWVRTKYGVPASGYADFATLRGDPSDGLPGVPGVGDKTAAELIRRWGSLEALLEAIDDPAADLAVRVKLTAARAYLGVAGAVVRVVRDLPVPELADSLPDTPADTERLVALSSQWGLDSSVARLVTALMRAADPGAGSGRSGS